MYSVHFSLDFDVWAHTTRQTYAFSFTNKVPSDTASMFVNHFLDGVFSHVQSESNNIRRNISLWNISHLLLMKKKKKKKKKGGAARSTARSMLCAEFLSRTSHHYIQASQPRKGPCLSRDCSICKSIRNLCDARMGYSLPWNPPAGWKIPIVYATRQLKKLLHILKEKTAKQIFTSLC